MSWQTGSTWASVGSAETGFEMLPVAFAVYCVDPPFPSSWTNEKRNPKITYEFSMTENPGLLAV